MTTTPNSQSKQYNCEVLDIFIVIRLARKILEFCPPGRRRKGRPRNSWLQEVITGTREREIYNFEWIDREGWRRKVKFKL